MTSDHFHQTLQALIAALTWGEITYNEYAERYVALLEQFEREDES